MINNPVLAASLKKYQHTFHPVVPFNAKKDKLLQLNFTATNTELTNQILDDENRFTNYIKQKIKNVQAGGYVIRGEKIAHFGVPAENGNWPPHLHFQIIRDLEMNKGDYPGVCAYSKKEKYLSNCPDPDLVLNMMQYAV